MINKIKNFLYKNTIKKANTKIINEKIIFNEEFLKDEIENSINIIPKYEKDFLKEVSLNENK